MEPPKSLSHYDRVEASGCVDGASVARLDSNVLNGGGGVERAVFVEVLLKITESVGVGTSSISQFAGLFQLLLAPPPSHTNAGR